MSTDKNGSQALLNAVIAQRNEAMNKLAENQAAVQVLLGENAALVTKLKELEPKTGEQEPARIALPDM